MKIDPIELSKKLMACPSITPHDEGAIAVLEGELTKLGFKNEVLTYVSQEDPSAVKNLYARFGSSGKNLCFAGHTDVVPPGDLSLWKYNPFQPTIEGGMLYGRGASDMKTAIAAWAAAVSEFLDENKKFAGSLSLLITGDEEGPSFNGTRKVLEWMKKKNEKIDAAIVGEPTNPQKIGEMIKIGRRGSLSFALTVFGTQGHAAYPQLADNPVTRIINILHALKNHELDQGSEFFQKSNLEIATVDVGNPAVNVIPAKAAAQFNLRFNDKHSAASLEKWVKGVCAKEADRFELKSHISGDTFITKPGFLSELMVEAVKKETGKTPELSTTGGTSDARFIKDHCPVIEFGMINKTAHKVNEAVLVEDIYTLTRIYKSFINSYFP